MQCCWPGTGKTDATIRMLKDSLFYAKILLFGEYGIIEDSMGLSIPFNFYTGSLTFKDQEAPESQLSNSEMRGYLGYLRELESESALPCRMDLDRFGEDLDKGLHFDSSIPQGFGVGSSGALVAAIYKHYAIDPIRPDSEIGKDDLIELKKILGVLESYFHGKSSGLDPLICYLNLPVLIKGKNDLGTVGIPTENAEGKGAIFLLDSGQPGKTSSMVTIFMEKLKNEGFRKMVKTHLKQYNDACINAFLKRDVRPLFNNLKELSKLFLENFKPMIPGHFEKLWKEGIDSNAYYLKLCGSGGGGFILGFTQDLEAAKKKLEGHHIEVIYKF